MSREFKFLRPNSGKYSNAEEIENVPKNPSDNLNPQISTNPSRPPFNTIQEPPRIPKSISDHDISGFKPNKIVRTPTKPKPKHSDQQMPLRTPERQGLMSKNLFNWGHKGEHESTNNVLESKEEGRLLVSNMNTPSSTRGVSRSNLSNSECNSTQSTPTKSAIKPPNPAYSFASGSRHVSNMGARMANYAASYKGNPSSCGVDTSEVPYFELKEDPSFWMEHNVQVLIRVRPLNSMEKSSFGYSRCLKQENAQSITWIVQPETRFMFDHVAGETIDQETLFRKVGLPMVENCLSGYNSCMFAYGQTGSGKTFTMLGEIEELEVRPSANRGMTPRIFEFLFARIRAEEESRRDERLNYNCKCSFLEIYNEQITDLLDPSSTNLMLREDMKKGVYVENLSEVEVHTVGDILQLLIQGSSNRKVAATNMNRESSRSHSVFTCVIESRWEKDTATNFRFSRLNLVDLAGSERQKSSGAEGERLKEAANINKSLSTLGHVIMVLVDVANGKPRHIPYRDSRLTFLLQDSLGGNSKTMIIANISPSICSAAETLNTLKFAQRAKLIQNNAVINEDSSGDVVALKHQIQLLKEELSALKRENVTRSLGHVTDARNKVDDDRDENNMLGKESHAVPRVSCKQLKSLETTLAGALRREQTAESTVRQLRAEIQQLNRLVSQREEDTQCRKMMLKFREDKIQRMESVVGGLISTDDYLVRENNALLEEIENMRERVDKNPEVTRFALENIRLLDQVRQFQDLYGEGEREILMSEVAELRKQLISSLDENSKHANHSDMKLKRTLAELEESKKKLNCCLEENRKLQRKIEELHASLSVTTPAAQEHDYSAEVIKESIVEVPTTTNRSIMPTRGEKEGTRRENLSNAEDVMNLQLELEIVKIILQEQRQSSKETVINVTNNYEQVQEELKNAKLIIEALESQQIQSINEIEDIRNSNVLFEDSLKEKELEICNLKEQVCTHSGSDDSPLEAKLKKMRISLEKAKKMNEFYQSDLAFQASHKNEVEEVRKQVEAETAEVIVCLQEELSNLQQEVYESKTKEMESKENFTLMQAQLKIVEDDNEKLSEQLKTMRSEWDLITREVEIIIRGGNEALEDVSDEINAISRSIPRKQSLISEQFGRLKKYVSEKELSINELSRCLKDALVRRDDMDCMLRSLRGAALVMTETHQQECSDKDREIFRLTSELNSKTSTIEELRSLIEHGKEELKTASSCATAAFVIVNRLWELKSNNRELLEDELDDAKFIAAQKTIEASCILEKFEEVQDTVKEADIMINELMIANEALKLNAQELKIKQNSLSKERDLLVKEVESLNVSNYLKDQNYSNLEKQYDTDFDVVKRNLSELEDVMTEIQNTCTKEWMPLSFDLLGVKSRFRESVSSIRTMFEDVWSEIIAKDCTLSVFHLCYMGVLLETANGLNAENGLLNRGLCESNYVISELRERNLKSRKELEICRDLKGKLLANIKKGFDRMSSKVDENGEVILRKLASFENKIQNLQLVEEMMLQRSNDMGYELTVIMKELDFCNQRTVARITDDERLLKEKNELLGYQEESFEVELLAKDFELLVVLEDRRVETKIIDDLYSRIEDLQSQLTNVDAVKGEHLNAMNLKALKSVELTDNVDKISCKIRDLIDSKFVEADDKFRSIVDEMDKMYIFLEQCEDVKNIVLQLDCESSSSLQMEMSRKDDIIKGLLFDLSLLQESTSNSKDRKDETEGLSLSLKALEKDFEFKSLELERLESVLQEKVEKIYSLELDLKKCEEVIISLYDKNAELLEAKDKKEEGFLRTRVKNESLEMEVGEMQMALDQMSKTTESLKSSLDCVTCMRDELEGKVVILTKELEMARTIAEENEAIAAEAQEIAEIQKVHADEKEEEVKLLERSIEELESTINVLEQKVDIIKGEAERQRLQREELEMELLDVQEQMKNIKNNDSELKRCLDEKEKKLKDALSRIQLLEKDIASRDAEISRCKAHIRELNLHAEAQASEYKQKFMALEPMVEQLKFEVSTIHSNSSPKKLEKNGSKPRGSGSPFKCIGLGLVHQIKSEKDEELNAGKQRIEELEALATSRQKEILMLNARLAATESMTHDVIRDLLGVKLNMKNYANLMDNQKLHSSMGPTQHHNVEAEVKEQDVANLKLQINDFVKERNGWVEEIERKQAQNQAAHVALEKLRREDLFISTENEMLKMENASHKKKVMELEVQVKRLSGQQNIQQRIHHHAKIKEENNSLRCQNEDLSIKLRKTEAVLSRVKEELALFRAANGRNHNIPFYHEQQLDKRLKETEEEKLKLAQKLLGLCTTVLKAAGIRKSTSEISLSMAEEALMQLKNRVIYLEMELEDVMNRIPEERIRMSELRPQTSAASSGGSCLVRGRVSQTAFFSALDR